MNQKAIKFLASGFGSGLAPVAPGTFGTLAGVPICLLCLPLPWFLRLLVVLALMALSIYVAGAPKKFIRKKMTSALLLTKSSAFR